MAFSHTVTSFRASDVPEGQLGPILADYLALERLKIFRRLLVTRCGILAVIGGLAGRVSGFSSMASFVIVAAVMAVPAAAWLAELRAESGLARRMSGVPHNGIDMPAGKKVVKRS